MGSRRRRSIAIGRLSRDAVSGMIVYTPAVAIGLGSWWAVIPALLVAVGFVVRTALEDRSLQVELPGYAEYAARVRYRLLPGVW